MTKDELNERMALTFPLDQKRCRVCGWPLKATVEEGCVPQSSSMQPVPERRADAPPDFTSDYWFKRLIVKHRIEITTTAHGTWMVGTPHSQRWECDTERLASTVVLCALKIREAR